MIEHVIRWLQTTRGSGVILILLLLGLWQFSALYIMDTPTWPPVTRIFTAWYENVADGTLVKHLLATFWRQMLGYFLAVALGISVGLGYFTLLAERTFKVPDMYAGIFTLALFGYVLNRLFLIGESRLIRWHQESSGRG